MAESMPSAKSGWLLLGAWVGWSMTINRIQNQALSSDHNLCSHQRKRCSREKKSWQLASLLSQSERLTRHQEPCGSSQSANHLGPWICQRC